MQPTLPDGAIVLVDPRAYRAGPPQVGDIVVAWHPYRTDLRIVKRVTAVTADGRLHLRGDNPGASTDSDSFGPVRCDRVAGRVTARFPRRLGG